MNDGMTLRQIAQLASDRNGGAHGRAIDRAAKKAGLTLSYTTFDRILAGTYTSTPSRKTLEALAVLAKVPVEDVYVAAGVPAPMARFADQLPADADLLTGQQREAVLAVVRQFAAANRALRDREDVTGDVERPAPMRMAARRTGRPTRDERDEELLRGVRSVTDPLTGHDSSTDEGGVA